MYVAGGDWELVACYGTASSVPGDDSWGALVAESVEESAVVGAEIDDGCADVAECATAVVSSEPGSAA